MIIKSANNFDRHKATLQFATKIKAKSMAIQSQKAEADINMIVKRFGVTGLLPQTVRLPKYGDFGDQVFDYQTAMNAVRQADESFMALPPDIRAKFKNDPQAFMDFCAQKENLPELRKMGLAPPEKVVVEPKPMKVEVVSAEEKQSGKAGNSSGSAGSGKDGK